jgi:hypothetical protein
MKKMIEVVKTIDVNTRGIERIAAERKRQIEEEGFAAEHDDWWNKNELAMAALCYAAPDGKRHSFLCPWWPWRWEWWKPGNRVRELEKAGALIAAEIDRLLRIENKGDIKALESKSTARQKLPTSSDHYPLSIGGIYGRQE